MPGVQEWAAENEPQTRHDCIFCKLGEQATADLLWFRDQKRAGKKWTLQAIIPYFADKYGFNGRESQIRDHFKNCLHERWTG